ncbi:D-TA family PLP-dependent enzyme [Mucilaginibacter sp. X5P1]|uniref:D-TA family PLP-dependent enzyme n=1 Tax=Mucilaginibacter sp. X5P1 TaxID=2723088 RepID=UPI00160A46C7|nr:D-TA family PLP-dependent enzyme [Mucilaginibacter sp. X5P1]MBB6136703.1 D-serine deaminase-like pyridoxal phosphate-dependent protein [Mucilaginibacter sp. X5P1]
MEDWFSISDVDQVDTPALIVYPQRAKYNLDLLKTHIDNVDRLRPHVKTHKCKEVALLNIEAGINKFKCATIAEAEMLGMCKAKDVLLAYQPIGPKINRLISLIRQYPDTKYSCLIDSLVSAQNINTVAVSSELSIDVYIDINVGMNRSGIHPHEALALYEQSSKLSNLNVVGLHAYDGHIHDVDLDIRTQRCNESFAPVEELIVQLTDAGFNPVTIAGGTPTFPIHAKRKDVECSPGTFIYWDEGYGKACKEQEFLPAALVISRVVSLPDETRICADLGHKSIASENTLDKRVIFLNAPELKPVGHSEEHLVLEAGAGHTYKIGDLLYGLPYHICPTVALYERAITIEDKKVAGEWKTIARDRKINI